MMKVQWNKWPAWLRWLFSRTSFVYALLLCCLAAMVDLPMVWQYARLRSLNRLMPLFDDLAMVAVADVQLTPAQWDEYIEYYQSVADLLPEDSGGYFFLAFCQSSRGGDVQEVLKNLRRATELAPRIFWLDYNFGIALYNDGQYEEAARYLHQAITDSPKVMQLYMTQMILYRQVLSPLDQVEHDFQRSFAEATGKAYLLLAKSLFSAGNDNGAQAAAHAALSMGFDHQDFYRLTARSMRMTGKVRESAAILQAGLQRHPMDVDLLSELQDLLQTAQGGEQLQTVSQMLKMAEQRGFSQTDLFAREKLQLF